jgi:hypothetical protein
VSARHYALVLVDDRFEVLECLKDPVTARLERHPGIAWVKWQPSVSRLAEDLLLSGQFAIEAAVELVDNETLQTFVEAHLALGHYQESDRRQLESLYVQEAAYKAMDALPAEEPVLQSLLGWPLDPAEPS